VDEKAFVLAGKVGEFLFENVDQVRLLDPLNCKFPNILVQDRDCPYNSHRKLLASRKCTN
jgi:hypothetical protein